MWESWESSSLAVPIGCLNAVTSAYVFTCSCSSHQSPWHLRADTSVMRGGGDIWNRLSSASEDRSQYLQVARTCSWNLVESPVVAVCIIYFNSVKNPTPYLQSETVGFDYDKYRLLRCYAVYSDVCRCFGGTYCFHFQGRRCKYVKVGTSSLLLAHGLPDISFFDSWKWRQYFLSKRRWNFIRLHSDTSRKIV
jgi:hypothetical protein